MSLSERAHARCSRFAGQIVPPRGERFPAETQALDRLPDSDILSALLDLREELRLAVYLADVEGYPYSEIAEIMGMPVRTVASCLHHGRARLRDRLAAAAVRRGLATTPG